jgi:DNA-binding CsgD family transcriptional regulator
VTAELATMPATVPILDAELVGRSMAWAAMAHQEHSLARDRLARAADEAREHTQVAAEVWLRHDIARVGGAEQVVDRLHELAAVTDGELPGLLAQHAAALAARDGRALDEVADALGDLGSLLLAAEAAADASRFHAAAGLRRAATASASRSSAWAAWCQGARTPALGPPDATSPLTLREREIASLAARGLSSKEIAGRLFLSPRTVDNHLQAVFGKLGVSSRRELASRLG